MAEILEELLFGKERLGPIPTDEKLPKNDPRLVAGTTLTYLEHNRGRIHSRGIVAYPLVRDIVQTAQFNHTSMRCKNDWSACAYPL